MEWGHWKPLLTALALPPVSLLLLAGLGLAMALRHRRSGLALAALGCALLWWVSTPAAAVWLARQALPQFAPISATDLAASQAIVVLGGGVQAVAPEYGAAQPSGATLARLRYGIWLARRSGKPLAFSGGVGWAADAGSPPEAEVARRVAREEYGMSIRWVDDASRDTRENARAMATLLARDGITRIALVTDATHMPRAMEEFRAAGLQPAAAATGHVARAPDSVLAWLPSPAGLSLSHRALREWLGMQVARR